MPSTVHPSSSSRVTMALPIPELAPVTTASLLMVTAAVRSCGRDAGSCTRAHRLAGGGRDAAFVVVPMEQLFHDDHYDGDRECDVHVVDAERITQQVPRRGADDGS